MHGENSTAERFRTQGAHLVASDLIIYPIRHHSPACSWHLRTLIAERPPSAVLIEGPSAFDPLIPTLVAADAVAPFAVYAYATTPIGRVAAYYPFCDYSPELLALRAAARLGIPARFIDLGLADHSDLGPHDDRKPGSLIGEQHLRRSRHLSELAARLGCRDHEELWEHLFECDLADTTVPQHIARVVAYCELSRSEVGDAEHLADGTTTREREMAGHICRALDERDPADGPVLVVVGGYHAVSVHELVRAATADRSRIRIPTKAPLAAPTVAPAAAASTADGGQAVIRYSFERLDRLNGYASGMTSPGWFQLVWEHTLAAHGEMSLGFSSGGSLRRVRDEVALQLVLDVAADVRRAAPGAAPLPSVIAAYEQAVQLARLRRRSAPARVDVADALKSCLAKGDSETGLVEAAVARVLTGSAIGRVPATAARPPLVADAMARLRQRRLKIDDGDPHPLALELYRRGEHRLTSRLLHGLDLLGVPLAVRTGGPDFVAATGLGLLHERWEYEFTPLTEGALVEAARYGSTLPEAVASRFDEFVREKADAGLLRHAGAAVAVFAQACVVGLHDQARRLMSAMNEAITEDAALASLTAAATRLGVLVDAAEPLETATIVELPEFLAATYARACFVANGREAASAADLVPSLVNMRSLLAMPAGATLDSSLFWHLVDRLRGSSSEPIVRGACAGLSFSAGRLGAAELSALLGGHLDGLLAPRESVAFLSGLLATAREVAWQQADVVRVIDRLLHDWNDNEFIASLPDLRLAFATMTPAETDRITEQIAALHGGVALAPLHTYDLSEATVHANLARSTALADLLVADGLGTWIGR